MPHRKARHAVPLRVKRIEILSVRKGFLHAPLGGTRGLVGMTNVVSLLRKSTASAGRGAYAPTLAEIAFSPRHPKFCTGGRRNIAKETVFRDVFSEALEGRWIVAHGFIRGKAL